MIKESEDDYRFEPARESVWIGVKKFNIKIHATDEGVVVDIWGDVEGDAPIASTYAFDDETEIEAGGLLPRDRHPRA